MNFTILYEDNHIIAVDKMPGLLTQQDHSGAPSLLDYVKLYIKEKYNKPGDVFLGLVHRLDRPVSGIVIFARTSKAARRLHQEFISQRIEKYYIALVEKKRGANDAAALGHDWIELCHHLVRRRGFSEVWDKPIEKSQEARLRYAILASSTQSQVLLIQLLTGRKHQIRAQLASAGMPIAGDTKYGAAGEWHNDAIGLHAVYLSFKHPTRDTTIQIISESPEYIKTGCNGEDISLSSIKGFIPAALLDNQ